MVAPSFPETLNLADYCLFDRLAEGMGSDVALRFGDQTHTYADVAASTRLLRAYLALHGVRRGERVLIALPDSPAYAWAFFATLHHGAVVAMGNPHAPAADLLYLLQYTEATAVITTPEVASALGVALAAPQICAVVLVPDVPTGGDVLDAVAPSPNASSMREALDEGARRAAEVSPAPATHRDDVAIWLFTSGSTGKSKAAIHTHRDFVFNTEVYAKGTVGYRRGDVTVSVPRLFFGYATGTNLMFPFAVGASVGLFAERPTSQSLGWAIVHYRPTIVTNVPTMMGKLLDDDDARAAAGDARVDLSSVRFHLSAGEALPPALLARFVARFGGEVYDGIGSAEMFHIYCSNRPGDVKPGSLGRVVDGYELKILASDADGPGAPELPRGQTGVMWVRGDSVALGYHRDRDKSWSTFMGHWCRTGDLFRMDEDGYLWFSGRVDDLLKVGGIWVAPVEVEDCLTTHPLVSMAAVIGAEDDRLTKPKAFIVLRESASATEIQEDRLAEELKAYVRDRLSKHKYPRWIAFVSELPKNDRGKVCRKTLKEREARGENPRGV